MATLNLCQFIGNVGKIEPARFLPDGKAVANLSLAVNESYKDKSGNKVEQTEWVRVVAFGKLAEIITQHVLVGNPIYIAGKIKTRKWEKDGHTNYTTEIVADTMQMLGQKQGGTGTTAQRANEDKPQAASDDLDDLPF